MDGSRAPDSFDIQLRGKGLTSKEITNGRSEIPPEDVAVLLVLDVGEQVRVHEVYAYVAGVEAAPDGRGSPVRITRTYIRPGDERSGEEIASFTASVDTRPPSAEEAAFLNLDADARVFRILHTGRDEQDQAVTVSVHILPLSLWSLSYQWPNL